jgi:predicted nucleic acid-binding protein
LPLPAGAVRHAQVMRPSKAPRGYTLDTGVLIALARRKRLVAEMLRQAALEGRALHIPMAVVAEFWRGPQRRELAELVQRAAVGDSLERSQRAGMALASAGKGPSVVDALVAALAAELGDAVLTSDPVDLGILAEQFPGLRVLAV